LERENRSKECVWRLSFDPPCSAREPVEIGLWRRREADEGNTVRRAPRIATEDGAFQGVIALRRPGDWSGRLAVASGSVARDEESFVAAWGRMPDDPLTLAGVTGFRDAVAAEVATGPARPVASMRSAVRAELSEGRVDLAIDTVAPGHLPNMDLDLPAGFMLEGVDAAGLLGFSHLTKGRLHFEFTPVAGGDRRVALRGHMLVSPAPALGESRRYTIDVPWPRPVGFAEERGTLTVLSPTRPVVDFGPGVVALPLSNILGGPHPLSLVQRVFQVEAPSDLRTIQWPSTAARVGVYLQSRLTVASDRVDLDATIRYEVAGGPLDVVYLRVPTEWAESMQLQLVGGSFTRTVEPRGDLTVWTIRPDRSIWGTARLRLRSTREGALGHTFAFPDIVPLGQGRVDKIVSVERSPGTPIELEGSSGLQAIDRGLIDYGWSDSRGASLAGAYRVTSDKWSLTVRTLGEGRGPLSGDRALVREVESMASLAPDGAAMVESRLTVQARLGTSLHFRLSPSARVLGVVSGGRSLPALSTGLGAWSIPFDSIGLVEVVVLWTDRAGGADALGSLTLPQLDQAEVPSLLSIVAPSSFVGRAARGDLEPVGPAIWRIERAERLARRALRIVGDFDRGSKAEQDELSRLLAGYASEARLAEQSARFGDLSTPNEPGSLIERVRRRLERTRQSIEESLDVYGLEDFRADLEGRPALGSASVPKRHEPNLTPLGLGRASYYRSVTATATQAIAWERTALSPRPLPGVWVWLSLLGTLMVAARPLGIAPIRPSRSGPLLAVALLMLAVLAPVPGFVLLAAAWVGRT
jgi:hypothetical protein